ncbi:MAG: hypothetical protein WD490_06010, partial [Opitutales bacterium]
HEHGSGGGTYFVVNDAKSDIKNVLFPVLTKQCTFLNLWATMELFAKMPSGTNELFGREW